jgi:signal recognition particle subunit SRP54
MGGVQGMLEGKGMDPKKPVDPRKMAQINQSMAKMMDPRILQQMGGMAGIQNMMTQFQNGGMGGGMGDMGAMQAMMKKAASAGGAAAGGGAKKKK